MSYPQPYPPQGYPAAPPQQPMPQQAYADPNAAHQHPAQGYAPQVNTYAQQPMVPQFQAPPAVPQQAFPAQPQQGYQPMAQIPPAAPEVEDTSGMFGGAPSISWDIAKGYVLGTPRGGQIIAKRVTQQTDAETKALKFYTGSNQPMMQIELTLQTRERTDANDDGKRKMYVKGEGLKSARSAFEKVGARDLEIGGWFYAANTAKNGGKNGKANVFDSVYARPGEADPLGHLPPYVAPQLAAPAQPQQQFVPPQQPNYPVPGQAPAFNPYAGAQGQQAYAAAQPPAPNPYGYGHQPQESPGGQAYASAQQVAQGPYGPQQQGQSATPYGLPQNAVADHAQQVQGGPPAGYNPFGG